MGRGKKFNTIRSYLHIPLIMTWLCFFQIWNVHSVLNVLYSLVEKSKINHQVCLNATCTCFNRTTTTILHATEARIRSVLMSQLARMHTLPLLRVQRCLCRCSICLSETSFKSKINTVIESYKYVLQIQEWTHTCNNFQESTWQT